VVETSSVVEYCGVGLTANRHCHPRYPTSPLLTPRWNSAVSESLPGGQVATRSLACAARWGLKGTLRAERVGDDSAGALQQNEMLAGRDRGPLDQGAGLPEPVVLHSGRRRDWERTVLWKRDHRLELLPSELKREWVDTARLLHVGWPRIVPGRLRRLAGLAPRTFPVTADL